MTPVGITRPHTAAIQAPRKVASVVESPTPDASLEPRRRGSDPTPTAILRREQGVVKRRGGGSLATRAQHAITVSNVAEAAIVG